MTGEHRKHGPGARPPQGVQGKDGEVPSFGGPGPAPRRDRPRGAGPDPMAAHPGPRSPGTPATAVRIRGLRKHFGEQAAVDGIDLDVPAGQFVGLVGPNGAGKTTTLSMVTGLLRPDSGTVEVVGHDVWRDPVAVKSRIGVLPEGLRLFERLSGRELLVYTGALRGIPSAEAERRATQLLDVLDLAGAQHKLVVDYSTGMRKKIGLAAALLHNPEVLFLDEPFEGVDPVSAQTIRRVLERYTDSGATVVFSSHVMELVESLCQWVAVMATGSIRAHGPLADVRGEAPTLHEAFLELVGAGERAAAGDSLDWLGGGTTAAPGASGGASRDGGDR
jgi:ABC-2 type transport system ATP-binding protein